MSLFVAAMTLAAAQPEAEPPVATEIEVIGNKLRDWRGKWKVREGVSKCKTTRSTRDKAIDAIGCNAMMVCMAPIIPQWEAIHDAKLARSELKSQINALMVSENVGVCVRDTRKAGIDALVAERRSKRS